MELSDITLQLFENIDEIGSEELQQINQANNGKYLYIVHCWQGRLQINVNAEQYVLDKDHILLCLPSFLIGNFMRTPDCRCVVLCVRADYFESLIDRTFHTEPHWWEKYTLLKTNPILPLDEQKKSLLEGYYALLKAYMADEPTDFRKTMLQKLAELAYYEISSYFDGIVEVSDDDDEQIAQSDRIFRRFMNLLLKPEFLTEREVTWYAEQLYITPKYLSNICREKSGKTASQWIKDTLNEQIRRQLVDTDLPIKDLAYCFRFPSQSFFGKYVRQNLGVAPQTYRKEHSTRK